jgi:hypothetical protein
MTQNDKCAMPEPTIGVMTLTGFSVSRCGECVRLGLTDEKGQSRNLLLPFPCLGMLLMTLPDMIDQAIRARTADPTMRHVYPLERCRIEVSQGTNQLIIGLSTGGGFEVRFALSVSEGQEIGERLVQAARLLQGKSTPSLELH